MPTAFVVLGTPRSGTSLVAGILHHLGIPMGERLLPAHPMNERGFYQDIDFEEIFDGVHEWMPEYPALFPLDLTDRLAALVRQRCQAGTDWGVKFRLAAHVLLEFQRGCPFPVKLLVTARPRSASLASLARWSEPHDSDPAEVIDTAMAAIATVRREANLPTLTVDYDALVDDAAGQAAAIATFVGRPLTAAAVDFVRPSLRHYAEVNHDR